MAIINVNLGNFNDVINGEKPILVEYHAPWCTYCRRIAPALDKIAEQFEDTILVGKSDIDENPQLAEKERLEVVPTFILYNKGIAVGKLVAPDSKAQIEQFINESLTK